MATYYVDYEGGSDANDGLSFANRKKTITSATTSISAGDTVRVMASPTPTGIGTATIQTPRLSHQSPRSLSTINYSTTAGLTTVYTSGNHYYNDGDTIQIYNNSNGRDINGVYEISDVTSNSFRLVGYTANANTNGSGGSVRNITQKSIKLASPLTQTIASTSNRTSAWTASSNVTATLYTNTSDFGSNRATMEGHYSDDIVWNSTFTTGKAAYWQLPSTLDLSSYQQVSFQILQYAGTYDNSGNYSLVLCSDTTGDVGVHTCAIPHPGQSSGSTNNSWRPIVNDFGTNLDSAINSVAIYVDSDIGAQSIRISNIIACKASSAADSITHKSLIGLGSSGPYWYPVESIDGTRVLLGSGARWNYALTSYYYANHGVWFSDTGGTYTFYKRECIDTSSDNEATSTSTNVQVVYSSGSSGNPITISGGWNRTDMTTQTSETFFDGINGYGYGIDASGKYYIHYEKLGLVRYYYGMDISNGFYNSFKEIYCISNNQYGVYLNNCDYLEDIDFVATDTGSSYAVYIRSCDNGLPASGRVRKILCSGNSFGPSFQYCGVGGLELDYVESAYTGFYSIMLQYNYGITINNLNIPQGNNYSTSNSSAYFYQNSATTAIGIMTSVNQYYGIYSRYDNNLIIEELNESEKSSSDNYGYTATVYGVYAGDGTKIKILSGSTDNQLYLVGGGAIYSKDLILPSSGTEYNVANNSSRYYSKNHDGVVGDYLTGYQYGSLTSDTTTRHTASGYSWKADITSSNASYGNGVFWDVAKVVVEANSQITASIWVYRTGTGVHGGLRIDDGQIAGIGQTSAYCMGSAGSWEQVTLTATPTEDGVIAIVAEAYYESSTSHDLYFDDFDVTQA